MTYPQEVKNRRPKRKKKKNQYIARKKKTSQKRNGEKRITYPQFSEAKNRNLKKREWRLEKKRIKNYE